MRPRALSTSLRARAPRRSRPPPDSEPTQLVGGSAERPSEGEWQYAAAQRPHALDVRALAVIAAPADGAGDGDRAAPVAAPAFPPTLVSGGLDTKLCALGVADFDRARARRIYPFPCHRVVAVASRCGRDDDGDDGDGGDGSDGGGDGGDGTDGGGDGGSVSPCDEVGAT